MAILGVYFPLYSLGYVGANPQKKFTTRNGTFFRHTVKPRDL